MRRGKRLLAWLAAGLALYWAIPRPAIRATSHSREVYDRRHRLLRLTISTDEKYRRWVPLKRMSPTLVAAMLLQEDRHFRRHPGVNPYALARAFRQTYLAGGRRIGGSTITMQLARMRFRLDTRTPAGKAEQILRALQLERHYSKDEILEAYLNAVPFGGNVEGVGAASLVYFGKDAGRLDLAEALALCVIPKSPVRRNPSGSAGGRDALQKARLALFERWAAAHPQDLGQRPLLELAPALRRPSELPFQAPHFADAVLQDDPAALVLQTTLDLPLQRLLERKTRRYVESKARIGIKNAAAMLVDTRSMEVRAVLGSADFFDPRIQGQVNGTRARRSPGSALKPFLYGLAMDQGLLHPMSMLKDSPMSFGGFNPENFDRDFVGPIHAWEALVRSRNVPAVHLARQLEPPGLHGFLKSAGLAPLKEESFYGLTLPLGGAEMTMEELVRLYAMLANGGLLRPLRTRIDDPRPEGARLLSAESSFMVLDILKDNPRPSQGLSAGWTQRALPVHWKTGTSFAYRDAWSVGVFGHYALAVWVGDFAGESNPAFVGVEAAAPLMFEIIDAVKAQEPDMDVPVRPGRRKLAQVEVCSVSGQIPGPACRSRRATWFIPGKSPIKACDIHREVLVDSRTGTRACAQGPGVRPEVFEFWPSDLLKIFRLAGIPRRVPPADNPSCELTDRSAKGLPPMITSPQPGLVYNLRAAGIGKETLSLAAVTDADARALFWFVNDRFVGKSKSGEPFFWTPQPGDFIVRVVDDQGRSDARDVRIAVVQ